MLLFKMALADPAGSDFDIYSGYYSREQNNGEMARASRNSHYIRFYPENRIVRLIIPFPYSTTISPDAIRTAFKSAVSRTSGSAYISDTFGVLEERVVAQLDTIRIIQKEYYFDCGVSTPCRIEFNDNGMKIIQKGMVKDHVTAYDLVPDQAE